MSKLRYFLIYKPYGMLSQFSREGDKPTLADLNFGFPGDVYPAGRLDADSEGLLLTNDKQLNHRLLNPWFRHNRTYYVPVEGALTDEACRKLAQGVPISVDGKSYHTLRLVRWTIENLTAEGMAPGDICELSGVEVRQGLRLN